MNTPTGTLLTMAWTFGLMSLLAIGGANSTIPENASRRRRGSALDVGCAVRGYVRYCTIVAGTKRADRDADRLSRRRYRRCAGGDIRHVWSIGRPCLFRQQCADRSNQSIWPEVLQAALVPISIGLMSASGFILTITTGGTWVAVVLIVGAAALALATRLNPLWILIVGGILGFAGVV